MSLFVFIISLLIVAQHVSGNHGCPKHVEQLLEEKQRILKVTSSWFFLSTLQQSVLSPFLWTGTMIDSYHSPESASLFQIETIRE
jgi:hypothetical protein